MSGFQLSDLSKISKFSAGMGCVRLDFFTECINVLNLYV